MLSMPCLQAALVLSIAIGIPAQPASLAAIPVARHGPVATPPASAGAGALSALDGGRVRAEFAKSLEKHTKAVEDTDSIKGRAKLEAKHPARKYWRKFAAEARKGDGLSLAWMLEYAEFAGFDEKKTKAEVAKVIELLTLKYSGEAWIGASLELVHEQRETHGVRALRPFYEAVVQNNTEQSNQAMALYRLAWMDKRAGDKEESERRFKDLAENFRKTRYGTAAASMRVAKEDVDAGGTAPDFYAETLEGHAVSLSDYRGKVVLLDFYGFW